MGSEYWIKDHDEIPVQLWNEHIKRHPHGTYFHTHIYFKVLSVEHNIYPFALFIVDSDNNIAAMLSGYKQTVKPGIFGALSRRIVINQSPLYNDLAALEHLLQGYMDRYSTQVVYTEIRNHIIDDAARITYLKMGFNFKNHLNYRVNCTAPEITWRSISNNRRRQIQKSLKAGVCITDSPNQRQLSDLYKILSALYKNKIKKPLFTEDYFLALMNQGDQDFYTKFFLVEYENRIIGGIVAPVSKNKVIHEHFVAGLDSDYKSMYPSVMATWAAIDFACRNCIAEFDFMGAGSPAEDYGVREFKARFGGELMEPGRYTRIESSLKYLLAEKGFAFLQKCRRC